MDFGDTPVDIYTEGISLSSVYDEGGFLKVPSNRSKKQKDYTPLSEEEKTICKRISSQEKHKCLSILEQNKKDWKAIFVTTSKEERSNYLIQCIDQVRNICNQLSSFKNEKNLLFGDGNLSSSVVYVALCPNYYDITNKEAFSNDSSRFLKNTIDREIGTNQAMYLYLFPYCISYNKKLSEEEKILFIPYVKRILEIIRPKIIVAIGKKPISFLYYNLDVHSIPNENPMDYDRFKGDEIAAKNPKKIQLENYSCILSICPDPVSIYLKSKDFQIPTDIHPDDQDSIYKYKKKQMIKFLPQFVDLLSSIEKVDSIIHQYKIKGKYEYNEENKIYFLDPFKVMQSKEKNAYQNRKDKEKEEKEKSNMIVNDPGAIGNSINDSGTIVIPIEAPRKLIPKKELEAMKKKKKKDAQLAAYVKPIKETTIAKLFNNAPVSLEKKSNPNPTLTPKITLPSTIKKPKDKKRKEPSTKEKKVKPKNSIKRRKRLIKVEGLQQLDITNFTSSLNQEELKKKFKEEEEFIEQKNQRKEEKMELWKSNHIMKVRIID